MILLILVVLALTLINIDKVFEDDEDGLLMNQQQTKLEALLARHEAKREAHAKKRRWADIPLYLTGWASFVAAAMLTLYVSFTVSWSALMALAGFGLCGGLIAVSTDTDEWEGHGDGGADARWEAGVIAVVFGGIGVIALGSLAAESIKWTGGLIAGYTVLGVLTILVKAVGDYFVSPKLTLCWVCDDQTEENPAPQCPACDFVSQAKAPMKGVLRHCESQHKEEWDVISKLPMCKSCRAIR